MIQQSHCWAYTLRKPEGKGHPHPVFWPPNPDMSEATLPLDLRSEPIKSFPVSCDLFMLCLVTQSCPNLCDPMGCSPPGFSVHGDFPGKNTGVGSHGLLQGNFPNPGIKPRSFTLQADFLPAEAPGKPKNIGVGSLSLLQRSSQPGNQTRVSPALQVDSLPSELPGKCIYW